MCGLGVSEGRAFKREVEGQTQRIPVTVLKERAVGESHLGFLAVVCIDDGAVPFSCSAVVVGQVMLLRVVKVAMSDQSESSSPSFTLFT